MEHTTLSIRPFIGAKDYYLSRSFYRDLGFRETVLTPKMCLFQYGNVAFYLQDAYVKDWVDNTMVFMEVENVHAYFEHLTGLNLTGKYEEVRLMPVREEQWGKECFLHDPSGVLWHIGEFA